MDQVETNGQAAHFYKTGDIIKGYNEKYQQTSLGADDKNGIWIILKILAEYHDISFIISCDEEVGCLGIKAMHIDNLIPKDKIALVLDRRGFGEILNEGGQGKYCGPLAQVLCNFWNQFNVDENPNFHISRGSMSDTGIIAECCEAVNIGVGYYNAHSNKEYTNFKELERVYHLVRNTITQFKYYPTPVDVYRPPKQMNLFSMEEYQWNGL
ncbi:MAG: hypothetical protein HUJ56_11110 [Erysipelotrichaceae bacterium]|nr:hypothetical protein [Erysipelotrichaceae bacterium]